MQAVVWIAAIVFAFPLIYAVRVALSANGEAYDGSVLPDSVQWENFAAVFQSVPFLRYIGNSLVVATIGSLVTVTVSILAGYAFSRLRWKGRDIAFMAFLGTLMIPQEVIVVPMFILMQWFGWVNSYEGLVLPFAFTAFGTFLMRQFFRGIPFELEEAARVDGAGPLRSLVQIIVPLAKPAVAVLTVFTFMAFWNSYLWPLIIVSDYADMGTIPIGLASFTSQSGTQWNLQMAATLISMVPTVVLVIVLQRHLVRGITMAGLAGR